MVSFSSPAIQYPLQFLAAVVVMLNIIFLVRTLHGCAVTTYNSLIPSLPLTPPSPLPQNSYSLTPHSFSLLTPNPLTPSPLNSLPPHTIPQLTIALTAAILQNMLPLLDTIARIEAPVEQLAEGVDRGLAFFNATNMNSSSLILIAYSIARETATGLAGELPYTFSL